jgi:GlcNAc-PI de-N-acetylase
MWTSGRQKQIVKRGSTALLVIAHPDDEAMFFSPLLLNLKKNQCDVSIICLSTGGFDGLGSTRRIELLKSAEYYGISRDCVKIVDHLDLQDGKENDWPQELISELILDFIRDKEFDTVRKLYKRLLIVLIICNQCSNLLHTHNPDHNIRREGRVRSSKPCCNLQRCATPFQNDFKRKKKDHWSKTREYQLRTKIPRHF